MLKKELSILFLAFAGMCFACQTVRSQENTKKLPPIVIAQYDQKLAELEYQIRDLTGKIEVLTHTLKQTQAKLDVLNKDVQGRLTQLEASKSSGKKNRRQASSSSNKGQPKAQPSSNKNSTTSVSGTAEEKYQQARQYILSSDFDKAQQAFQEFTKAYPKHKLTSNAYYWLGETYYARDDYAKASAVFAEGYKKFPNNAKTPGILLKLGMSLQALDRPNDACKAFNKIEQSFKNAPRNIMQLAKKQKTLASCK